jgi:hypothetical protein
MKKFIAWLLSLFGIKPNKIPEEIMDETTAYVDPEEFISEEDIDDLMDDATIMDELEDLDMDDRLPSKFAVLIGINKYDPSLSADLRGCVNDVEGIYNILTTTYNFPHDNVRVLTDFRATSDMIIERINWLLDHNVPGDELVLHYSGHGSQVRDRDGDELNDYLDEILCPTDLDWNEPLTDDDIKWIFDLKEDGVFLTFICDSCHSGSITRSNTAFSGPEEKPDKARVINPPLDIKSREGVGELNIKIIGGNDLDHVLISGCRDDQTSADAYIDGKWQGAMTASLIQAIKNNPYRDWTNIHADMISILNISNFTQKPQLSGNDTLIKGRTIFGS